MLAKQEKWKYAPGWKVWAGKYLNSRNLPHWHYDCELFFVERGRLAVHCADRTFNAAAGEMFFVDGGTIHYMNYLEPGTVTRTIVFDPSVADAVLAGTKLRCERVSSPYGFTETYRRIMEESAGELPYAGRMAENAVELLVMDIFRGESAEPRHEENITSENFRRLLSRINDEIEFYSFGRAASDIGMSEGYFSRYFHRNTGMTFSDYLNCVRVEKAVEMLRRRQFSVTETAGKCGFSTIRNFNRVFRKLTGYSPATMPGDYLFGRQFYIETSGFFVPTLEDTVLEEASFPQ